MQAIIAERLAFEKTSVIVAGISTEGELRGYERWSRMQKPRDRNWLHTWPVTPLGVRDCCLDLVNV